PVFNNHSSQNWVGFFKELPFRVVFSKQEEHEYIADYLQYFNSQTNFSIHSFEKLILELMGKGVENKAQQQSVPIFKQEKVNICSKCGSVGEESAKFCKVCGTPIHVNVMGNEPSNQSNYPEIAPSYAEGTTVLYADREEQPNFPYLIREKTQEKIDVNKPTFRIGKDSGSCDYSVIDNNAVSRNHANIISKNGRYYIIDNRSTNSTYVDGRAIPVQTEVEIFSGTKVKLANEPFVFYL
ncbi:MAG: FHA domain-containing protein, partial [Bacillus sp. (in: firmicutes)]